MAYNVKFLKGTEEKYKDLAVKDTNTFYQTETNLYLGDKKLTNSTEIAAAILKITKNETDINALKTSIGSLEGLNTTAKDNLVAAINEVRQAVESGGTDSVVTMETSPVTSGALKSYIIKQGTSTVGTIDIPKDMVVQSGEVVKDPKGQEPGTYIKLTLANVEEPLYINVGTLVDLYTAKQSATQVQIAVDNKSREISATIVAGGVGTAELKDNAVVTAKIADANVTKTKLSTDVQTSLGKADSAVQLITTGTTNGTIAVDGSSVPVKGLGSAAYTESSAYDVVGAADTAKEDAISAAATDATSKANKALADAKAYADAALTWDTF